MDRYTMRKRIIATSLNKKRFLSGVFLTYCQQLLMHSRFLISKPGCLFHNGWMI